MRVQEERQGEVEAPNLGGEVVLLEPSLRHSSRWTCNELLEMHGDCRRRDNSQAFARPPVNDTSLLTMDERMRPALRGG